MKGGHGQMHLNLAERELCMLKLSRRQVEEIMNCASKHAPAVLQNESHPYLHEKDLRDYCRLNKIVFQVKTR